MSNSYPVDFKGTAFGDPAVYTRPPQEPSAIAKTTALAGAKVVQATPAKDQVVISEAARQMSKQATTQKIR